MTGRRQICQPFLITFARILTLTEGQCAAGRAQSAKLIRAVSGCNANEYYVAKDGGITCTYI